MKKNISGGLMLLLAVIFNSLNLALLVKARFGVSTLSSVPLTIHLVIPSISIGVWTTVVQIISILVVSLMIRKFKTGYLLSFLVAIAYGIGVDIFTQLLMNFPTTLSYRLVYLLVGFIGTAFGSALFIQCKLPILPFDLVVREIAKEQNKLVRKVRTSYDILSLSISVVLSLIILKKADSIGFVTVFGVLFMGRLAGYFADKLDTEFEVVQYTKLGTLLEKVS